MIKNKKVLIMPRTSVIIRFIDIPSLDEPEISQMVRFQALKELPCRKEEMIIGYRNLGSYREGFSSIMLTIARRDMIQKYIDEQNNSNEGSGCFSPYSTPHPEDSERSEGDEGSHEILQPFDEKNSPRAHLNTQVDSIKVHTELLYLFLVKNGIITQKNVNLIIDIGRDNSEILIIDKSRPIFSRGFQNNDNFLKEVERTLLVYKRHNPVIEEIIVTYGFKGDVEIRKQQLERYFDTPVKFYEYSGGLTCVEPYAQVELMPEEISAGRINLHKKRETFVTYCLTGIVIILILTFCSFRIYEKGRLLSMISSEMDKIQSRTDEVDRLVQKIKIARYHREQGKKVLDILRYFYNFSGTGISLSAFGYDGTRTFYYKGTAREMAGVFGLLKRLEAIGHFEKVEIKYASRKKIRDREFTDFYIQCQLRP